ncbi:MAG: hypothetical protein BWY91_01810 [bacterium ADurb.BinA028]|nr:MAG: hypothetical protein BWY91_01810 [bacterium ADurb.BinA028]
MVVGGRLHGIAQGQGSHRLQPATAGPAARPGRRTLTHRRDEVDRVVGPRAASGRIQSAVGFDVVDRCFTRDRGCRRFVLAEPAGLIVLGMQRTAGDIEGPGALAHPPTGAEVDRDRPLGSFAAPGVPLDRVGLDAAGGESIGDALAQRGRGAGSAALPQPHRPAEAGDILPLGEDRAFVLVDLLDRPPGALGDLIGGHPRPDHRLHVAWSHAALDLDLQLSQPRTVTAGRSPQRLVERDPESGAVDAGEQEVPAVVVNADQPQVLHAHSMGRLGTCRHDSLIRTEVCEAATPDRYRGPHHDADPRHDRAPARPIH